MPPYAISLLKHASFIDIFADARHRCHAHCWRAPAATLADADAAITPLSPSFPRRHFYFMHAADASHAAYRYAMPCLMPTHDCTRRLPRGAIIAADIVAPINYRH